MLKLTKDDRDVFRVLMNAPGADALRLYSKAEEILVARNLIKAPRIRKGKDETHGNEESPKL